MHEICYCGFKITQALTRWSGERVFLDIGEMKRHCEYVDFIYTHVTGVDGHHGCFRSSSTTYPY